MLRLATELRIGNLLTTMMGEAFGHQATVVVEINHLKHIIEGNLYDYRPVLLTTEVLENNFNIKVVNDNPKEKPHYQGDVLFNVLGYEFSNSEKGQNGGFYCYQVNDGNTIFKYVHKFQNWYYFTFNKELEIFWTLSLK